MPHQLLSFTHMRLHVQRLARAHSLSFSARPRERVRGQAGRGFNIRVSEGEIRITSSVVALQGTTRFWTSGRSSRQIKGCDWLPQIQANVPSPSCLSNHNEPKVTWGQSVLAGWVEHCWVGGVCHCLSPWRLPHRQRWWRTWPPPQAGRESRRSCRCGSRRGPSSGTA